MHNQDVCYDNFLCLSPLGKLSAFNHVFSNIGYVCGRGILFIALVRWKKRTFAKAIAMLHHHEAEKFGVSQDPSLFYAIGVAMVMEGVMSGCYHICPRNIFFQFDTTFMYLIGILVLIKLYQNRHPDLSLGAIKTAVFLGILLIFEAISYYESSPAFWIIFCLIYLLIITVVAFQIYTQGALKYNFHAFYDFFKLFTVEIKRAKAGPLTSMKVRLVFVAILVVYNVGHVSFIFFDAILSENAPSASGHMLLMIMAHGSIYVMFYTIMKLIHKEYLTLSCKLYLIASAVLVPLSAYFFYQTPKDQFASPSVSRGSNQECLLFNFFDSHDLWHFLSGGGLFTTFMFLLNIDEDLKYTQRRLIPVF